MVQCNPSKRPSAEKCLLHEWFASMQEECVPIHPAAASARLPGEPREIRAGAATSEPCGSAFLASSMQVNEFGPGFAAMGQLGDPYTMDAAVRSVGARSSDKHCMAVVSREIS